MSGVEYTPIDEISGLPLLLVPEEGSLPYLRGELPSIVDGRIQADWNHAYHPAREVAPIFRSGRIQHVLRPTHDEYHAAYYGPPPLESRVSEFRSVVLAAAGYIPPEGILFTNDGPRVVIMSPTERERLRTTGEVKMSSLSNIQAYIRQTVLAQPADHIQRYTIDKFLSLDSTVADEAREKYRLANLLTALLTDRIEDPIDEAYNFGRVHRLVSPSLPTRPGDFIHRLIFISDTQRKKVTNELTAKLAAYRDGILPHGLGSIAVG